VSEIPVSLRFAGGFTENVVTEFAFDHAYADGVVTVDVIEHPSTVFNANPEVAVLNAVSFLEQTNVL
jgi:hypothetical protein